MTTMSEALGLTRNPPAAKFEHVNDEVQGTVTSVLYRKARKFGSSQIDTWPDGTEKWEFVIVLDDGSEAGVTVYARNFLLAAIRDAVSQAEATEIVPGAHLSVAYTANSAGKPGQNPAKLYSATYRPPVS